MSSNIDTVSNWFAANGGGSLQLPDGWFGRPYDNIHKATAITEDGNTTIIVLDHSISIAFNGTLTVSVVNAGKKLQFSHYRQCNVSFPQSLGIENKLFESGEVSIVAI